MKWYVNAATNSRDWNREQYEEPREHGRGLFEEKLERGVLVPDDGHECHACGGRRWVRMVNRMTEDAPVMDRYRRTRVYAPGESYITRCDVCSKHKGEARHGA